MIATVISFTESTQNGWMFFCIKSKTNTPIGFKMEAEEPRKPDAVELKRKNVAFFSSELEKLHQYCVDNDIDSFKTFEAAKPFLKWHNPYKKSSFIRSFLIFSALVALLAVALNYNPVNKFVSSTTRNLNLKLFRWFGLSSLSNLRCFIPNPLEKDSSMELREENCEICSNLTRIKQVEQIDMEEMSHTYLNNSLPLVLTHQDVYRNAKMTVKDIIKMYLEDDVLSLFACCRFSSNIKNVRRDQRVFLTELHNSHFSQYYAHWQNCFTEAAKLFRKVYKRPVLLPSSVELSHHNWLFISSDYAENQSIQLPINASIVLMIQISGYLDIIAEPKQLCQSDCKKLGVRLQPRSILIAPTFLYNYKYRPSNQGSSITVGLEGSIDL